MAFEPKKFLAAIEDVTPKLRDVAPQTMNAFDGVLKEAFAKGVLDAKTKELIGVALSVAEKCPYCIPYHVRCAKRLGITKEEMIEAGMVAVAMGGAPSLTYVMMLEQAIEEVG